MDLIAALEKRRSVRTFSDKEVSLDLVKEIIRLGTLAPTACNRQGWRFIIVSHPSIRKKIYALGSSEIILKAPVGILVLYNKFTINMDYPDNVESAAACIQNMLLAATSFGLGTCWINHLPSKQRLRRLFNIPQRYDVVAYVALGYSAIDPRCLPRKYSRVDELISYDKFEMNKEIESRKVNGWGMKIILYLKKGARPWNTLLRYIPLRSFKINDLFKVDHD